MIVKVLGTIAVFVVGFICVALFTDYCLKYSAKDDK